MSLISILPTSRTALLLSVPNTFLYAHCLILCLTQWLPNQWFPSSWWHPVHRALPLSFVPGCREEVLITALPFVSEPPTCIARSFVTSSVHHCSSGSGCLWGHSTGHEGSWIRAVSDILSLLWVLPTLSRECYTWRLLCLISVSFVLPTSLIYMILKLPAPEADVNLTREPGMPERNLLDLFFWFTPINHSS